MNASSLQNPCICTYKQSSEHVYATCKKWLLAERLTLKPLLSREMHACVSPDDGDVRRQRGQELGEKLNTTQTHTITWTREFGAANNWAAFSVYCFSFYSVNTKSRNAQWPVVHRATSTSIPMPTMPLKHRSSQGHVRAILAMPSYAHGSHRLVLVRMQTNW